MAQVGGDDPKARLEKIKKQLNAGAGSVLLHGPLLKRSETLRKWNQRWFTLDPSTGKVEYRFQRGDPSPRGLIDFDADSTITVSPLNIHCAEVINQSVNRYKYEAASNQFYLLQDFTSWLMQESGVWDLHYHDSDIGTSQKKESFLCAETPAAARAWVASLRAAALVLKAHKEAVNSLSGNGNAILGTVAASVAAANATAQEAMKDIQASFRPSVVVVPQSSIPAANVSIDNSTILKETLRVKDEELNQLQRDLRARDLTIKELAERLSETADAAESAAKAVRLIDKDCQVALTEVEHLKKERLRAAEQIKAAEERIVAANKTRDLALQEAHRWRVELGKAREQCVIWEGAVQRGHEYARQLKKAHEQELASLAQAQEPRTVGTEVNAKVQDERPSTAETIPKGSNNIALIEPHVVSSPGAPEAESAEGAGSLYLPSEHTNATPQVASSDPEIAENIQNNLPVEITPQILAPEPAVLESSSSVVTVRAPPPVEQHGLSQDGADPPAEQAEGAPVKAVTIPVLSSSQAGQAGQADQVSSAAIEEIPMNESGA